MIIGAHAIVYSQDSDADRAFMRDVLGFPHVDVGGGWLIFGLPPSEVAVHPAEKYSHELYLMCDDVAAFVAEVAAHGVAAGPVLDRGWGLLTEVTLPSGNKIGIYEPRHARPAAAPAGAAHAKSRARAGAGGNGAARAAAKGKASSPARAAAKGGKKKPVVGKRAPGGKQKPKAAPAKKKAAARKAR